MTSQDPDTLQAFYQRQDAWFRGVRSRLLRAMRIGRRERVLDLGAGTGETLDELQRRARGRVVALDADRAALSRARGQRVQAHATALPFADHAFDLVFTQMFFLWAKPLATVLADIRRVLQPGTPLIVAAEPDYGGVVSDPPGALQPFADELTRDGADVQVARSLGPALRQAGFAITDAGVHPANPLAAPQDAPGSGARFLFVPCFWFVATA